MIIEYEGKHITNEEANIVEAENYRTGINDTYLFRLSEEIIINGENEARWINHCSQPNCEARIILPNQKVKYIVFFALRKIPLGM